MPEQVILINLPIPFLLSILSRSMKRTKFTGRFQLLASNLGLNGIQVLSDAPKFMKKMINNQPQKQ